MPKKNKGFGQPQTPTRDAKRFMLAFRDCVARAKGNQTQIYQFFQSNLDKLDESLLEALPRVFTALTADQSADERESIARLFGRFGDAIQKFPLGDRWLNLELSISAYRLVLKVFTCKEFSVDWAGIQNNLGNAYSDRIRGDLAENLEHAITAYEQALQVYTRDAFPKNWAGIQNNLSIAYCDRIRGDRAENLEHAIVAFEKALQVYTRDAFPVNWAMTQKNLGNAYLNRIRGDRAENLEYAIVAFEKALQVRTRDAFPEKWAMTQGNQAEALMQRALLTENLSDLDTAITLLQAALEVAVPNSPDFIDSQYRLGNALSRRYDHSQNPADLQQALAAYKIALDAINPEHYDRNQIWQAIPETQSILGSRLVREGKWQEGLQLLLNSVRQLSTGNDSLAHANALFQTGRAYETLADWDNARLYYRDALRLYAHLDNQLGVARSQTGLGSVLVSQGYLEKGMAELAKAKACYQQLQQSDKAADVDHLYQTIERALQRHAEVSA